MFTVREWHSLHPAHRTGDLSPVFAFELPRANCRLSAGWVLALTASEPTSSGRMATLPPCRPQRLSAKYKAM